MFGTWADHDNGSWLAPQTLEERGIRLKTHEDAVWAQVELYAGTQSTSRCYFPTPKPQEYVQRARDYKADGLIMHKDMGTRGYRIGFQECKLALVKEHIPTCVYVASQADPREYNPAEVRKTLGGFVESFGLVKLFDLPDAMVEGGDDDEKEPAPRHNCRRMVRGHQRSLLWKTLRRPGRHGHQDRAARRRLDAAAQPFSRRRAAPGERR